MSEDTRSSLLNTEAGKIQSAETTQGSQLCDVKLETEDTGIVSNKPTSSTDLPVYREKRIRCPECRYYTTENEEKMTRHIRKVHRGENPFQCYMCDYTTYNKVCFEEHVRVHQGIKPYKCSFCSHRTVSKKNMKKHELVHRPDNPLKCKQCEYFGRHKRALEFHMRECHYEYTEDVVETDSGLSCKRCGIVFESKALLRNHNKSKIKCKDCEFVGCSRSKTTLHRIKKHGFVPAKRTGQKKKADMFKCALCGWSSSNSARVLLHLIHHPNQSVDESVFDLSILRKHGIIQESVSPTVELGSPVEMGEVMT